jgi:hypothetical protein
MAGKKGRTYDLKLTMKQREEMVEMYRNEEKVDYIASLFGVGREYPSKLAHRRGLPRRKIFRITKKENALCLSADGAVGQEHGVSTAGARTP